MTDLAAFLLIAGMALFGWFRGTVAMVYWAGGLLAGYGAALLLFRPVGALFIRGTHLPEIFAYPIAGLVVMILVSSYVGWHARRHRMARTRHMARGLEPPQWDAPGGAALGAVYGGALAMILAWAVGSIGGLYGGGAEHVRTSLTGRAAAVVSEQAFTLGARAVVGDPFVARTMAHMVADPATATRALQDIMADERVQELVRSGALQRAATSGDPMAMANHPSVAALARDEAFVSALRGFGVLPAGDGPATPLEVSTAITREAGPVLRSVEALRHDPEIQEILTSDSFRATLAQGDYMALAGDPRFSRLFDRIMAEVRRHR